MNGKILLVVMVTVTALVALLLEDSGLEGVIKIRPRVAPAARWIPAAESLSPSETLVADSGIAAAPAPEAQPPRRAEAKTAAAKRKPRAAEKPMLVATPPAPPRSRLHVEARRFPNEPSLQQAAMRAIAQLPDLSGQISVESRGALVHLSGWTATAGQSLRVEKAVAAVKGVRGVRNRIRSRVGAVTS